MKIFGYESLDTEIVTLRQTTLQASVDELRQLSAFIDHSISLMEKHGKDFGHAHFSDFKHNPGSLPDIIIVSDGE